MQNITSFFGSITRFLIFLTGLSLLVLSCTKKEDDDPTPDSNAKPSIPGDYVLASATLAADVEGIDSLTEGKDVQRLIYTLFSAAQPCRGSANLGISFRESKELYFVCHGEDNERQVGTWSLNDDSTTLSLIVSTAQVPIQFNMENLNVQDSMLSGRINNITVPGAFIDNQLDSLFQLSVSLAFKRGTPEYNPADSTGGGSSPEDVLGNYLIGPALLTDDVPGYDSLNENEDVSRFVEGLLGLLHPCSGQSSLLISLRENGELYLACDGEDNERRAGTWSLADDGSSLTMVFVTPLSPLTLTMEQLTVENNELSGRIDSLPIPRSTIEGGPISTETVPMNVSITLIKNETVQTDPNPNLDSAIINYRLTSAVFAQAVTVGSVTVPSGFDATQTVLGALLPLAQCGQGTNAIFSFWTSSRLFSICEGSQEANEVGTWSIPNDSSSFTIDFTFATLNNFTFDNLQFTETTMVGTTTIEYPAAAINPAELTGLVNIRVRMTFTRQPR